MAFLDPLLGWLLYLHPAIAIILISLIISLLVTLALKFLTNQTLMKEMKDELKELQKEMKALQNNPKKLAAINTRFMETNMKYMSQSMKPTFYTFIPVILIFGWLNANMAFYPIMPNQQFEFTAYFDKEASGITSIILPEGIQLLDAADKEVSQKVTWELKAENEGEYELGINYNGNDYKKSVLITTGKSYSTPDTDFRKGFIFKSSDNGVTKLSIGYQKIQPFVGVPILGDLPWIGTWSWFGVYILFSFLFSMLLRKVFNVY